MKTLLLTGVYLACCLMTANAQSDWYVDANAPLGGSGTMVAPFASIPLAMAAAATGDTIYVHPGTYGGIIDFAAKGVSLQSLQGRAVTFIAAEALLGNSKILVNGSGNNLARIAGFTLSESPGFDLEIQFEASSIEMKDCDVLVDVVQHRLAIVTTTIDNCYFNGARLVHSITSNYPPSGTVSIINSEFTSPSTLPSSFPPRTLSYTALEVTIDNCDFHDTASTVATNSVDLTIKNSIISNVARVTEGSGYPGSKRIIENCLLSSVPTPFFAYPSSTTAPLGTSAIIRGVQATNCGRWAIEAQSVHFEDCSFSGLTPAGDYLIYPVESTISLLNCRIQSCPTQALVFHPNHFYALSMTGCMVSSSSGPIFSRGPLTIAQCSFSDPVSTAGPLLQSLTTITVMDSIFRGGSTSYAAAGATFLNCNIDGGWTGSGSDNIDIDPLFVDPGNGDLHLQANSPMIDAASTHSGSAIGSDLDGDARVIGRYSDIGADEFDSGGFALRGTDEDFAMSTKLNLVRVNGLGVDVAGGDLVSLSIQSPSASYIGSPVYVFGEIFTTGGSPILPVGHPAVHLNLMNADLLFDPALAYGLPGWTFGLPMGGLNLTGPVPFGFSGLSYRVQAFAVWPLAMNGWYAATDAVDLVHQ